MLKDLASAGFASLLRLRREIYRRRLLRSYRAPIPTISIGNLTVGGTGKTPMTIYLAEKLLDWGRQPLILIRGYRSPAERTNLIVREGGVLRSPRQVGDEAHLLALRVPRAAVVAGSRRSRSAQLLLPFPENGVILLDDAFQHLSFERDLDLLLIDASNPFGNGRLLPAGPLREPLSALQRADALLLSRAHLQSDPAELHTKLRRWNSRSPIFSFGHRFPGLFSGTGLRKPEPAESLRDSRVLLLAALGNPGQFEADARRLGAIVTDRFFFRDHHRYTSPEIRSIAEKARRLEATILTTEKDAVKLDILESPPLPLKVLRMEIEPLGEDFEKWLKDSLERLPDRATTSREGQA